MRQRKGDEADSPKNASGCPQEQRCLPALQGDGQSGETSACEDDGMVYGEFDLALALGTCREVWATIRKERRLIAGRHWSARSGEVRYGRDGVIEAMKTLGFGDPATIRTVLERVPQRADARGETVRITALCRNDEVVRGVLLRDGSAVMVRIGRGRGGVYAVGMEFLCRPSEMPGVYVAAEPPPRSDRRY